MSGFTCPGLSMPQPEGAPQEGYVPCFLAGHACESTSTTETDETGVRTTVRCRCCGDFHGSMFVPHELATEWAAARAEREGDQT